MARKDADLSTSGGGQGAPRSTGGNPGILKVLWADLRKREQPASSSATDDPWFEDEQEERRAMAMRAGTVRQLSQARREKWRRWYYEN